MAVNVVRDAKLYLGARDLTGDLNAVALNYSAEALEVTRLGDNTRKKIGGLKGVTVNAEGFVDPATSDEYLFNRIAAVAEAVTIGKDGGAAGDPAFIFQASAAGYNPVGGAVGEVVKFSFDAEASDSDLVDATILHTAAATTASGSSTPQNLGAVLSTEKLYATLHAFAASAADTLDIIIESDVDAGFASPTTRATFTQITAAAGEWITPVVGPITDTWWRISWTIAGTSPSFDFVVAMGIQE